MVKPYKWNLTKFLMMTFIKTIPAYCRAIRIPPPKYHEFDVRRFEENRPTVIHQIHSFRKEMSAGGFF